MDTTIIEGDKIVVSSDEIATPIAVRYGWADNPEGVDYITKKACLLPNAELMIGNNIFI